MMSRSFMAMTFAVTVAALLGCKPKPAAPVSLPKVEGSPVQLDEITAQTSTVFGPGGRPKQGSSNEKNTVMFRAHRVGELPEGTGVSGRVVCQVKDRVIGSQHGWSIISGQDGKTLPQHDVELPPNPVNVLPSACETSFRYGASMVGPDAPKVDTVELGTVCYLPEKNSLTVGPCPEGAIRRKPSGEVTASVLELSTRFVTNMGGFRVEAISLVAPQKPLPKPGIVIGRAVCESGDGSFGRVPFSSTVTLRDQLPGEAVVGFGVTESVSFEPKRCELEFKFLSDRDAEPELAGRFCLPRTGDVVTGACGFADGTIDPWPKFGTPKHEGAAPVDAGTP